MRGNRDPGDHGEDHPEHGLHVAAHQQHVRAVPVRRQEPQDDDELAQPEDAVPHALGEVRAERAQDGLEREQRQQEQKDVRAELAPRVQDQRE
jgi:hypothetical protein